MIRPGPGYKWLVFAVLAGCYVLVYFHRLCPAVVALDMMRDLSAGPALMGLLASVYFYPYGLIQPAAGLLSDSWGPRLSVACFFTVAGLGALWFGAAQTVGGAVAARVLVGLGAGMVLVPAMKTFTCWFAPQQFARMIGLFMAMGGVGMLLAGFPLAWLSDALGWRGSFMAIGVLTLLLAIAVLVLVRNRPSDLGLPPAAPPETGPAPSLLQGVRLAVRRPVFWMVGIWFGCTAGMMFTWAGLWGGPYLMQVYGLNKAQAGNILSMVAVGTVLGSPFLSWLSESMLRSRKRVLLSCSLGHVVICAIWCLAPDWPSPAGQYLLHLGLGLFASASSVVGFTAIKESFPLAMAGTATGLANPFPFMGAGLMQVAVGLVLEGSGAKDGIYGAGDFGRAFIIFLGVALVGALAAWLLPESHPQATGRRAMAAKPS